LKAIFKAPRKPKSWRAPSRQRPCEAIRPHKGDRRRPYKAGVRRMVAHLRNRADGEE